MNTFDLREKIEKTLSEMSLDSLKIVAEFVDFIKDKQERGKISLENQQRLDVLRRKIAIGQEQIEQKKITDGELVFERIQEKLERDYGVR